ncbi:MAG: leucine-rich repeat protein [Odoribacteraceae bacterium]|jgi:hypothetical protein|nr:leucine-rich repeat protein [Odoribacteraceae bacterium]
MKPNTEKTQFNNGCPRSQKSGASLNILSFIIALFALGSCEDTLVKSAECDITAFTVDGTAWTISGANITYTYPPETEVTPLTPAITVSEGATITPASGAAQDVFTAGGLSYTVTAENGTTKTYVAKATKELYSGCDITAFTVDNVAWTISGTDITYTYPLETMIAALTPIIEVSHGASITPASGTPQYLFPPEGVSYTVTAENGTTKTYTARATKEQYYGCDIISFVVDGRAWIIDGTDITYSYLPGTPIPPLSSAVIELSPRAALVGSSFTADGATYTIMGENGETKTYTARVTTSQSGVTGECRWAITADPGGYTLTISGNGDMAGYDSSNDIPWNGYKDEIRTLAIEDGVTSIAAWAFSGCSGLTSATISNSVTDIDVDAFRGCIGLTSVTIPNSVEYIGRQVFSGCTGLTSVVIPSSVKEFDYRSFENCSSLTSVTISSSVKWIGYQAFIGCSGLTSVINYSTTPQDISEGAFSDVSAVTLRVPSSALDAYKSAERWKDFGTIEAIQQ